MSILFETDMNLKNTLECGQCFRWNQLENGNYFGIAYGKPLEIRQTENGVELFCSEDDFNRLWYDYFDLGSDYDGMRRELSSINPILDTAAEYACGIHILRQEPWEAICSFIISQNNNIPRIKGIIERFCALLGDEIGDDIYAFPDVQVVAGLTTDDLAPIRSGFRAKYIVSTAATIASGDIDLKKIAHGDIAFGREELQKAHGIGPKVAECALLYGFNKTEGFPMDVWMKRVMQSLLPNHSPEAFGKNAGLAQQYLFHYSRMHPELFKD